MSQTEVEEYLKKVGEAMTREILKELSISQSALYQNLKRLRKSGDIIKEEMNKEDFENRGYSRRKWTGRQVLWKLKEELKGGDEDE